MAEGRNQRIWELVEELLAHDGQRDLAVRLFQEGKRAGEVACTLSSKPTPPNCHYSRDDVEIWRRHFGIEATGAPPREHSHTESTLECSVIPQEPAVEETLEDRVEAHRAQVNLRSDKADLRKLLTWDARRRDYLEAIEKVAPTILTEPKLWPVSIPEGAPTHEWVLFISDVQLGQKTELRETGGLFEQNSEIVAWQFEKLWETVVRLHDINSRSKDIRKLHIILNGDLVEGDSMRRSQLAKVDRFVTEQTMEMVNYILGLVSSAAQLVELVDIYICPGNHDRTTEKGDTSGLGEAGGAIDTYAWLMGQMLKMMVRQAPGLRTRVAVHVSDSFVQAALIGGKRFVWEHGGSIKTGNSVLGVPLHGIVNAAANYSRMFGGLDYLLLSHFHQANVLSLAGGQSTVIMNGAFPPSSDYVQQKMKVIGRPQQWLLDVHRSYGVVEYHPLYIGHPSHELSATYWDRLRDSA